MAAVGSSPALEKGAFNHLTSYRGGCGGIDRLSKVPEVTQLVSSGSRTHT